MYLSRRGLIQARQSVPTEGAFKRDRLAQEGANAAALPGANNYKKFLPELRQCEDLWIVLDSDANEAGQNAALEIAKSLRACTIVTLPLMPGQDKIGVDDFLEEYGYEAFGNIPSVRYESGVEQKATSLSILVSAWKTKVESYEGKGGLDTGYPRFDSMLEGVHEGSLVFVAGAPHHAKTSLIEDMAVRLYHRHPNLEVSYYSNDDSLFTTLTRWVAKLGRLQQKDCRYPMVAFANDAAALARFEAAAARLSRMSDRLTILDRSYNISLEKLKAELVSWRKENPKAQRVIFIDAFTKTKTDRDTDIRDEMNLAIYKSSLLKEMAQQAHVPIICTHEVPKLGGRRPNSWNLKSSATLEYDADVILLCFQEAHVKGINHTSLKIEYDSGEVNPVLEVIIAKDKMCGTPRTTDLFEIQKANSRFVELDDSDYFSLLQRVRESERNEWKN
jgi:replicative DNA helicase